MPKVEPYVKLEIEFFLSDARFKSLTPTHRMVYLGYWVLAVKTRRENLTYLESKPRYIADALSIDPRSVRHAAQKCTELGLLTLNGDETLTVVGARVKHPRLHGWGESKQDPRDTLGIPYVVQGEGEGEGEKIQSPSSESVEELAPDMSATAQKTRLLADEQRRSGSRHG